MNLKQELRILSGIEESLNQEANEIIAMMKEAASKGQTFLSVNCSKSAAQKIFEEHNISYTEVGQILDRGEFLFDWS